MAHNWTDEWVKYLDFIAHFDISHDAPHWQRARYNNMITIFKAGHQANRGGVRHVETINGKNGTHNGGKTKSGVTKGNNDNDRFTLRIASGKLLASEKFSIVVQVDLSSDSICSLADFTDFALSRRQQA